MKKHYPWLWFDADGTLFDYNQAEPIAIKNTFDALKLPFQDEYLAIYRRINQQLWQALERGEITPAALHARRFELLMETIQLDFPPSQFGAAFMEQLALRDELIDGAHEVLHQLQEKCRVAIVTNGLQFVQRSRIALSPLKQYITELIISEEVGIAKPEAGFFEIAAARTGYPPKNEVLIIGDSLTSDIQGGADFGIDTCWFNPAAHSRPNDVPITYEISHLRELLEVLA
ncbi:MAG TPA: YjjG family noncanonical pyrimidine nucleotidase [Acidobacteriota bacterium]|nr:YjjG family noncanonical pyrimidine nucleotidase [Acidobacteriota bacterium]HNC44082.1 YjjG family noncanonical pyrimidine nucleotidase [Acidobacteriota bacterium]HNH82352.1 YjjG family noncanonical pyrimidine nucleotidase [Acidobacteriota bacterium]